MIFVLIYDRKKGQLLGRVREYAESLVNRAAEDRFTAELEYASDPNIEVVMLSSGSLEELTRTHARYFKTLDELRHAG